MIWFFSRSCLYVWTSECVANKCERVSDRVWERERAQKNVYIQWECIQFIAPILQIDSRSEHSIGDYSDDQLHWQWSIEWNEYKWAAPGYGTHRKVMRRKMSQSSELLLSLNDFCCCCLFTWSDIHICFFFGIVGINWKMAVTSLLAQPVWKWPFDYPKKKRREYNRHSIPPFFSALIFIWMMNKYEIRNEQSVGVFFSIHVAGTSYHIFDSIIVVIILAFWKPIDSIRSHREKKSWNIFFVQLAHTQFGLVWILQFICIQLLPGYQTFRLNWKFSERNLVRTANNETN